MARGNVEGGKGHPIVKYRDTLWSPVRKQLNRSRYRLGCGSDGPQVSYVRWGPTVLRDVAMASNFWMQFAINGFVGHNFGCMTASDMLFDSRGWVFGVKLSDGDIAELEYLRVVVMATNFGTKDLFTYLHKCHRVCTPTNCNF